MGYEDGRLAMRIDVPWVISILGGMLIGGLLVLALSGLPKRASRPNPPPVTQEMPAKASPLSPTPGRPAPAGAASSPNRQATVKPGNVKFSWAKQTGAAVYQLDWFSKRYLAFSVTTNYRVRNRFLNGGASYSETHESGGSVSRGIGPGTTSPPTTT